jgi:predicted DNA-binding transcriptional regulator AlpA
MNQTAIEQTAGAPQGASVAAYEGYIDKRECARRLGRTPRSVDTYMARGIIPFYKLGRTVAFKWSEVDAHIKAHYRVDLGRA